jgi:hypothetical protein
LRPGFKAVSFAKLFDPFVLAYVGFSDVWQVKAKVKVIRTGKLSCQAFYLILRYLCK